MLKITTRSCSSPDKMSNDKENFSLIVPTKMLENLFSFCFWKEIDLTLSGFIDWEKINLNDKNNAVRRTNLFFIFLLKNLTKNN